MKHTTPPNPHDMRNMILAAVLCTGLLFVWQVMYVNPREEARRAEIAEQADLQQKPITTDDGDVVLPSVPSRSSTGNTARDDISSMSRADVIKTSPRVRISSPAVHGSINLDGLRFDDLTLVRHRVSVEKDSPEVVLLTPARNENRYFVQIGWLPATQGGTLKLPDGKSQWTANSSTLMPDSPVSLSWNNGQGVEFRVDIALDENYLFTIKQNVINNSGSDINVMPYGLINRSEPQADRFNAILHRGPIGVFNGELTEVSYEDLHDEDEKPAIIM